MKDFLATILGAVVLGSVLAYFFSPIWFWFILVIAIIGGILKAVDERKTSRQAHDEPRREKPSNFTKPVEVHDEALQNMEEDSSVVNPFALPIINLAKRLSGIKWNFPFLPQIIESVVIVVALALTVILYLTIGIASQIERTLLRLMRSSGKGASNANVIERSAYAIAGGIYLIVWLPFWLVLLPFNILGWLWQVFGYAGLVLFLLIVVAIAGFVHFEDDLRRAFDAIHHTGETN